MRIITGEFKGRKLKVPKGLDIRPAADRVKETIFNILVNKINFLGINVLDLFAGTGSLGIEAISRGAKRVKFVDLSKEALLIIKNNISELNCAEKCDLIKDDGLNYLKKCEEAFDLIFADPPYSYKFTDQIPQIIFEKALLKKNGYLLIEHSYRYNFSKIENCITTFKRKFGNTLITFFSYNKLETS